MNESEKKIRQRLEAVHPPPPPPEELLDVLKQQIPDRFAYVHPRPRPWWQTPAAWRVAASIVVVIGAAYVALRFGASGPVELPKAAPKIGVRSTELASPPPVEQKTLPDVAAAPAAPPVAAPQRKAPVEVPRKVDREEAASDAVVSAAPSAAPAPAAPRTAPAVAENRADRAVPPEPSGVEGGVASGVVGGMVQAAPAPAEAQSKAERTSREAVAARAQRDPKLIENEPIVYPEEARRNGVEGTVIVEAVIDPRGRVSSARVITGVDPDLDRAALDGVLRSHFEAPQREGRAVSVIREVPVRFSRQKGVCIDCD